MTREQYLQMRSNGNFNIIHNYYAEHFNHSKHKPFLGITELAHFLTASGRSINSVFDKCCKHYDEKFEVSHLLDKDGNLIKSL